LLAIIFIFVRRWKLVLTWAVVAALNWAVIIPHCCFGRAPAAPAKQALRVLLLNVHTENRRFDMVEAFIQKSHPDLIVLEEVNDEWMEKLANVRVQYPHGLQEIREDNFGIALFSKLPTEESEVVYLGDAELPSVTAVVQFMGKTLKILGTHPLPPAGAENSQLRNQQLQLIPGFFAEWQGPTVLLGDLNTTPWSHHFQRLLRDSGLTDSARGFGWQTTWPASLLPLRIAIDHGLISRDLRVVARQVGPNVGSDHLPLLVEIAVE
jgi:endonuclease/exonuclease/phosphatase (EEP) superfamily protein YafD